MNFTIKNEEIIELNESENVCFPKYTSQLINWANQNAQGTRPRVVGQLSDLFPEFQNSTENVNIQEWQKWYSQRYPNAIDDATERIYAQVKNLQEAIKLIDKDLVKMWVTDLVITKTFNGLYVQKAILSKMGKIMNKPYRLATPDEESQGIDGYVGDIAYSLKPDTYKLMTRLQEQINVKMVYYTKTKTGLKIEVEE
jgi:hypothetical protein